MSEMEAPVTPGHGWVARILAVVLVMFCTTLGVFLLVYPWLPCEPGFPCWDENGLVNYWPHWAPLFKSSHFRGAISGLGLVNIYVALLEAAALRRFTRSS